MPGTEAWSGFRRLHWVSAEASGRLRRAARALRGHSLFLLLLAGGAALRATAWVAYRPGLAFYADSYQYLQAAADLSPPLDRPLGYPVLLRGLSLVGPVEVVPAVQHVLGLGAGVGVYALLLRRSCRRWVAALASAPLLLDAYQVNIEQFLLSEMLFSVLLLGLLALVLLQRQPSTVACTAMGVVAAACTLTRTVALPLAVVLAVVLVLRRVGALRVTAYAVAFALPLLGYAAWFSSTYGSFGLERIGGRMVYGKVAPFADCRRLPLVGDARVLCDPPPPSGRSPNYYTWQPSSPAGRCRRRSAPPQPRTRRTARSPAARYGSSPGSTCARWPAIWCTTPGPAGCSGRATRSCSPGSSSRLPRRARPVRSRRSASPVHEPSRGSTSRRGPSCGPISASGSPPAPC